MINKHQTKKPFDKFKKYVKIEQSKLSRLTAVH